MILIRTALAVAVAVSGVSHAYLYVHGYHHIPLIGTAFLVQASISIALALLILIGGPSWLRWVAAAFRWRTGRVRAVAHRRAFRLLRNGMAAVSARGDQRGRRTGDRRAVGGVCGRPPTGARTAELAAIVGAPCLRQPKRAQYEKAWRR
jgi:hypothetical protein